MYMSNHCYITFVIKMELEISLECGKMSFMKCGLHEETISETGLLIGICHGV